MKLSGILVKNYRAIKELEIKLDDMTVVLGPNGSGKTTFLDAIRLFFQDKKLDEYDFRNNTDEDVEITAEFTEYDSEIEKQYFPIHGKIKRIFPKNESAKYYKCIPYREELDALDGMKASELRLACSELPKYIDLGNASTFEELKTAIKNWPFDHPGQCGYKDEIITINFAEYIDIMAIEALSDPSVDGNESKGSTLTKIVDLVVRTSKEESKMLEKAENDMHELFKTLMDSEKFTGLHDISDGITNTMQEVESDVKVDITWKKEQVKMPIPTAEVKIEEGSFANKIEKIGHGTQRLFLYAALQYYQEHKSDNTSQKIHRILIIDEPELHQHPIRQEAFYKILNDLSRYIQIIYTTHSQKFISISSLSNLRFFIKSKDNVESKNISLKELSNLAILIDESRIPEKIERNLLANHTYVFLESLFSKAVVLVEGPLDGAIINSVAKCMFKKCLKKNDVYKDLSTLGISIVSCSGKPNIREQIILFRKLNIPVYVVWDLDLNKSELKNKYCKNCGYKIENNDNTENNKKINERIYKYLNIKIPDKLETNVQPTFACFEKNIEEELCGSVSKEEFNKYKKYVESKYDHVELSKKNPCMFSDLVSKIYESNKIPTIEKIIDYVIELPKS